MEILAAFIHLPAWRHVQAKISAQHLRSRCNDTKEGLPLMHEAHEKMNIESAASVASQESIFKVCGIRAAAAHNDIVAKIPI